MTIYYEKVVPNLSKLIDDLPKSCLYLFNVFLLNDNEKKNLTELLMPHRLDFDFQKMVVFKILDKKAYKNAMNLDMFKRHQQKRINRN